MECQFDCIFVMLHTLSEDFFPGCTIRNSLMITSIPPVGIVCNTTRGYKIARDKASRNGVVHTGCPARAGVVTFVTRCEERWKRGQNIMMSRKPGYII